MERVREIGADVASLDEARLSTARHALLREIAREERADASRARAASGGANRRWIGLSAGGMLAASVAAVTLVVSSVVAPAPHAVPSAAAAELFERAALAVSASDASLAAGQFLRVEQTTEYLVTNGGSGIRSHGDSGFTYAQTDVLYVPADRTDDWVWERLPITRLESFGPRPDEAFESWYAGYDYRTTGVERVPHGLQGRGDAVQPIDMLRDEYASMPRDPQELLEWFRARMGPGGSEEKAILDGLWMDLPPADLRAAMYRALAMLPGFRVTASDGAVATLEISREVDDAEETIVTAMTIDTATGHLRSFSSTLRSPGGDAVAPWSVPDFVISFDRSIVDSTP